MQTLRQAAEAGDSRAQTELAHTYLSGRGTEKDYVEAIKWLRIAAESSNSVAQLELGRRYLRGDKVATNQIEGLKWLQRAASLDSPQAQLELSRIYGEGRGVGKDLPESYAWANLASPRIGEAADYRELLEKQMTFDQVLAGQERSRKLRQQIPIRIHPPPEATPRTEEQLAQEEAYQRAKAAADQRRLALESDLQNLGTGYSTDKGVKIDVGGPGGKSYGNYPLTVKQRYEAAWRRPVTRSEDDHTAEISVTVSSNGTILASRITRRSGLAVMDKSIESLLKDVKQLPPFPENARDDQRTFIIEFNPQTQKRSR